MVPGRAFNIRGSQTGGSWGSVGKGIILRFDLMMGDMGSISIVVGGVLGGRGGIVHSGGNRGGRGVLLGSVESRLKVSHLLKQPLILSLRNLLLLLQLLYFILEGLEVVLLSLSEGTLGGTVLCQAFLGGLARKRG